MAALTAPDGTALPDPLPLPTGIVSGRLTPPASKSVAQRVLNLALLSGPTLESGALTIDNPPADEDSLAFAAALETLGWSIQRSAPDRTAPDSMAPGWRLAPPSRPPSRATLDIASSGTGLRLLLASLSTLRGTWTVTGSAQLAARPVGGLVAALRAAGAEITLQSQSGPSQSGQSQGGALPGSGASLPLEIRGGDWMATSITVDASTSSQYLSALLMAAAAARHPVTITATGLVSAPYVDLTLDWMRRFGVTVERQDSSFIVHPGFDIPERVPLEGDWSSACYPMAGAALTGGRVVLDGLDPDSAQADRAFLDILRRMGAIEAAARTPAPERRGSRRSGVWSGEATGEGAASSGSTTVQGTGMLRGVDVDLNTMPDQVPTLACLAPFAAGTTTISGVAHLRHKESDRLAVLARELGKLGVPVEESDDGLGISGVWHDTDSPEDPVTIDPVVIDPGGDHRIAMAMAVLATRRPGVSVADPGVVGKSYAGFWQDWFRLAAGGG